MFKFKLPHNSVFNLLFAPLTLFNVVKILVLSLIIISHLIKPTLTLCYGTELTIAEKKGMYAFGLIFIFQTPSTGSILSTEEVDKMMEEEAVEMKPQDGFYSGCEEILIGIPVAEILLGLLLLGGAVVLYIIYQMFKK